MPCIAGVTDVLEDSLQKKNVFYMHLCYKKQWYGGWENEGWRIFIWVTVKELFT